MKKISALFLILLQSCAQPTGNNLTPKKIQGKIKLEGARKVVVELTAGNEPSAFDAVLKKISTGDQNWLSIAGDLYSGTDASATYGLFVSLAEALPKNPEGVLRLLSENKKIPYELICGAPFIEADPQLVKAHLFSTKGALENFSNPGLESERKKCLDQIQKVIKATGN